MAKYVDSVGLSKAFELIKDYIDDHGGGGGGPSFNQIYPVGSIYMSVNSTDPGTLFGGQWTRLEDVFLLGAGTNHAVGNATAATPTKDGGEEDHVLTPSETATKNHSHTYAKSKTATDSHTLTVSEIPAHKHSLNERNNSGTSTGWSFMTENGKYAASGTRCVNTGGGGGHTHGIGTASATTTGNPTDANGAAHNNMPPYLTVYMWKRTA